MRRVGEAPLRELIAPLGLAVVPISEALSWRAAALRARYYRRRRNEVSLADCCLVAAAMPSGTVVTGDRGMLEVARAEDLPVVAL